jgi:hypothetical protein
MTLIEDFVVGIADDSLLPRPVFDGMVLMQAGVAKVLHNGVDVADTHEALELISSMERLGRQLDAAKARVHESIDRTGVYAIDGHRGAKTMIAHTGKLSLAEAAARQKVVKVLEALPLVANAYRCGEISSCMVRKLGKVHSNPRVRGFMADADGWFLEHALNDTYEFFDLTVSEWERLADEDGAELRDARHERNRNHTMDQNDEGEWEWKGSASAYDGAISNDVFEAFEKIEFDIDWQFAVDHHGDKANSTHMPRSAAQRRADAFAKVHVYAARALAEAGGPVITTDVQIDDETFERESLKLIGEDVAPADPTRDDFACHTLSGSRLHPRTAVAHALLGFLRRNVIGADSVTIDLGRRRNFTGYARLAAQLNSCECYWPGCHVGVHHSQIDHLHPYTETSDRGGGGLTNPNNAGVACGKHNRHKERGYSVSRLPDGTIEIRRPDGTILK